MKKSNDILKALIVTAPPLILAITQLLGQLEGNTAGYLCLVVAVLTIAAYTVNMYWKKRKRRRDTLMKHLFFSKNRNYSLRGVHAFTFSSEAKEKIYINIIRAFLDTLIAGFGEFVAQREAEIIASGDCDVDNIATLFEDWLKEASEKMKVVIIRLPDGRLLDGIPQIFSDKFWELAGVRLNLINEWFEAIRNNELYPTGELKLIAICEIMYIGVELVKIDMHQHLERLNGHLEQWLQQNIREVDSK